jgi:dihydroxy-acid dehydratase
MPEVANLPLPTKLLQQGVRDMVRICDGRMSGTAYGTVVLHVAPEAAAGGPLARLRTGDYISLDVDARRLDVDVPMDEFAARAPDAATVDAYARPRRGWELLYVQTVQQANTGADLDFLLGSTGDAIPLTERNKAHASTHHRQPPNPLGNHDGRRDRREGQQRHQPHGGQRRLRGRRA